MVVAVLLLSAWYACSCLPQTSAWIQSTPSLWPSYRYYSPLLRYSAPSLPHFKTPTWSSPNMGTVWNGAWTAYKLKKAYDEYQLKRLLSPTCLQDLLHITNVDRMSYSHIEKWQKQMADCNGKLPAGVLQGNIFWMGDFTQCTSIKVWKNESKEPARPSDFNGKHCLGTWDDYFLEGREGKEELPMLTSLGICIPSTCTAAEAAAIVNHKINIGIRKFDAKIEEKDCQTDDRRGMDSVAKYILLVGAILGSLVLMGTIYEILQLRFTGVDSAQTINKGGWQKILMAFSAHSNTKQLLDTREQRGSISCFNGIRVVGQCLVMMHHIEMFSFVSNGKHNPVEHKTHMKEFHWQMLTYGVYAVDSFFFMTGFLLAKEVTRLNLKSFFFNRLWRITPMYVAVIAIMTGPFVFTGSGPLWYNQMLYNREDCLRTWWRQLLYIDIWFHQSKCMGHTWYLNVDMFSYLLSPLILYPFAKNRKMGIVIWTSIIGFCYAFTALAINDKDINTIYTTKHFSDHMHTLVKYTSIIHTKPWSRVQPMLLGLPIGYLYHYRRNALKFSKTVVAVGWIASALALLSVIATVYSVTDKDPPKVVYILFGTFNHSMWGIGAGWIIVACATGNGGIVNRILSWKGFVPLARLSFGIYLLHYAVVIHLQATRHENLYVDYKYIMFSFAAVFTVTVFLAWLLYITVDAPMVKLKQHFLTAKRDEGVSANQSKPNGRKEIIVNML